MENQNVIVHLGIIFYECDCYFMGYNHTVSAIATNHSLQGAKSIQNRYSWENDAHKILGDISIPSPLLNGIAPR